MKELRDMIAGKISYPRLQPRTKLAVLIAWIQEKFHRDSADVAWDNFRFTAQQTDESIQDWGIRVKRLKNKVHKYGFSVSWPQYLRKWTTGTCTGYFTAQLRESLCPSDYRRDPVVHDLMSFESWYQRFLQRQRNRERDLAEHARLSAIQKIRIRARETPSSPVRNPLSKRTPANKIVDRRRQGPAPPVTSNRHSNLFFRPPDSSSKLRATPTNIHEG